MSIDWNLLWAMDGHGPYVWGSYALALALVAGEALVLWRQGRRLRPTHVVGHSLGHSANHVAGEGMRS